MSHGLSDEIPVQRAPLAERSPSSLELRSILNSKDVLIEGVDAELQVGDRLPVLSGAYPQEEVLGFVDVMELKRDARGNVRAVARLIQHSSALLLRPGDRLERISYAEGGRVPGRVWVIRGRADLLFQGKRWVSSRYKRIVDQGLAGGTAQTLDAGEFQVGAPANLGYGITDRWMLSSAALPWVLGIPNAELKVRAWDGEDFTWSPSIGAAFDVNNRVLGFSHSWYVRLYTNSKLVSHYLLTVGVGFPVELGGGLASGLFRNAGWVVGSSFQSGFEYILDNFDRILIGPKFNFSAGALGGYLAYLWVWDRFHLMVGFQAANVLDFRLAPDAYLPYASVFWRI